ncbi:conserved hypothetical protein [Ricinus communis]|uniref:Mannan endo-1,4-beta-mannosidase n=1 Tax=Ricinus communis TaxID=3988 RepID=B9T772_RICCO|nr:conserved hypothetical protein [Ricinus communis]
MNSLNSQDNMQQLQGEYQITNGYGPIRASQIMREDFRFMSSNGINAVRISVGWWIAFDPTPPKPFARASLQALDNAFNWADIIMKAISLPKIIVYLHAAPGSQNGNDHSGTIDPSLEWGDLKIQDTGNNAEWNINNIWNDRAYQLSGLNTANGLLTFVGEWIGEWKVEGVSV